MIKLNDIEIENFKRVCLSSNTMAQAASKLEMHFNTFKRIAIKLNCYKPNIGGKGDKDGQKSKILTTDILNGKFPQYHTYKLKNRLFEEGIKENRCECCGISEWNNKPLNMEFHHKDGNKFNHSLDNLIILCPNCHSQTENFRSKNIKNTK